MSNEKNEISGEELGNKLLQSVKEMKAGKAARATQIATNEVASARLKTGLSQAQLGAMLASTHSFSCMNK